MYKTRHDLIERWSTGIQARNWNPINLPNIICKKLESILENEMHSILWDFEIQMDHLKSARNADLVIIIKNEREIKTYIYIYIYIYI